MIILVAIIVGIMVGIGLMFIQFFLIESVTKDLNEKEKEKYYADVARRTFHSMDQDSNGGGWFGRL